MNICRVGVFFLCLGLSLFAPVVVQANGLVYRLPKDGTWVTYHVNWQLYGPEAEDSEGTGTWTMQSVGTEMVDGKKCRWIEITEQLDARAGEPKQERTVKFLIPETALQSEKDPRKHTIRYWWKMGNNDAKKHDGQQMSGQTLMFLHGRAESSKEIKLDKTVLYQRGEFKFEKARLEKEVYRWQHNGKQRAMTFQNTLWLNEKVPFGTAASKIETKFSQEDEYLWTWTRKLSLNDFGTGAKSVLPDAK